jgi:hypothetical protein
MKKVQHAAAGRAYLPPPSFPKPHQGPDVHQPATPAHEEDPIAASIAAKKKRLGNSCAHALALNDCPRHSCTCATSVLMRLLVDALRNAARSVPASIQTWLSDDSSTSSRPSSGSFAGTAIPFQRLMFMHTHTHTYTHTNS